MHDCGGVFFRDIYEWNSLGIYRSETRIKRAIARYKEKYKGEKKWQFKVKKSKEKGYEVELFARREEGAEKRHLSTGLFWDLYGPL